MFLLLLLLALAPCLFLLWYFIHRDRYEPEPKKYIVKIYLLGALMVIPAALIEYILHPLFNSTPSIIINAFIMSFFLIAPTEELLKFFVVKNWIYKQIEFDEIMDGIVYCVASSLGFATVENIIYVLDKGVGTGILRAFLSVPGHAFFGALMGYYVGKAKFNQPAERKLIFLGLFWAVFVHGLYDFLLLTETTLAVLVIGLIITLGFFTKRNLKKAELQSKMRTDIKISEEDSKT